MDIEKVNRNQTDRGKQGIAVFSRVAQRDILASNSLEEMADGWHMWIRNPWYTGTYLSTVCFINITINGHAVPEEDTFLALRGQWVPAGYAKYLHEIWWGMGEIAEIRLADKVLAEVLGEKNEVQIDIDMRTAFSYGFPNDILPYRLTGELERKPLKGRA